VQRQLHVAVRAMVVIAIAAAIPFAIADFVETGHLYLLTPKFLEDVTHRFHAPGRFRFVLQPTLAILVGVRGGLADARAGRPPFLFGLLRNPDRRGESLRSALAAIGTLLAMGILLDMIYQVVIERSVHPGAALLVGPILICLPYALARALTARTVRWFGTRRG